MDGAGRRLARRRRGTGCGSALRAFLGLRTAMSPHPAVRSRAASSARWRPLLRALVFASTGAVVLTGTLVAVRSRAAEREPPSWDLVVRPTALDRHRFGPGAVADCAQPPSKILILAWDGADWAHILPLLEQGRMPHLAALMERGV